MTDTSRIFRNRYFFALACLALLSTVAVGCGDKKTTEAPPAIPAGAPAGGTAPVQGKVTTGADPDKAPAYPSMYGKPAGSK